MRIYYKWDSFGISPESDKISDYDLMIYIYNFNFTSFRCFNLRLKNIISNENFNKAPFFGQKEYAAKIGFGLYKKPELFLATKVLYKQS